MVHCQLAGLSTEAVNREDFTEAMYLVTKTGKTIKSSTYYDCIMGLHVIVK